MSLIVCPKDNQSFIGKYVFAHLYGNIVLHMNFQELTVLGTWNHYSSNPGWSLMFTCTLLVYQ